MTSEVRSSEDHNITGLFERESLDSISLVENVQDAGEGTTSTEEAVVNLDGSKREGPSQVTLLSNGLELNDSKGGPENVLCLESQPTSSKEKVDHGFAENHWQEDGKADGLVGTQSSISKEVVGSNKGPHSASRSLDTDIEMKVAENLPSASPRLQSSVSVITPLGTTNDLHSVGDGSLSKMEIGESHELPKELASAMLAISKLEGGSGLDDGEQELRDLVSDVKAGGIGKDIESASKPIRGGNDVVLDRIMKERGSGDSGTTNSLVDNRDAVEGPGVLEVPGELSLGRPHLFLYGSLFTGFCCLSFCSHPSRNEAIWAMSNS
jgi:hypothetical protein